jgi:hypothetical protein
MAITAQSDIAKALNDHLAGLSSAWPIAWPNVTFTPPANGRFYRVSLQPNDTETRQIVRGGYVYRGLLLVSVVIKEGEGEPLAIREANRIVARFDYLTTLSTPSGNLVITSLPSVRGGIVNGGRCEVPVVIRYELTTA